MCRGRSNVFGAKQKFYFGFAKKKVGFKPTTFGLLFPFSTIWATKPLYRLSFFSGQDLRTSVAMYLCLISPEDDCWFHIVVCENTAKTVQNAKRKCRFIVLLINPLFSDVLVARKTQWNRHQILLKIIRAVYRLFQVGLRPQVKINAKIHSGSGRGGGSSSSIFCSHVNSLHILCD